MSDRNTELQRRKDVETREFIIGSIARSMLVEAAAGTGKTTLLVDRILSGIRQGAFRMPELVAITFTDKAAAELESRLRDRLTGSSGQGAPEEQARIEAAIAEIDQAHISTIHAFCAALLRERPVEAGVDPEFEVLDGTQAALLREECWDAWIGEQAHAPEGPLLDALLSGVHAGEGGLKELADAVADSPEALDASFFELPRPSVSQDELAGRLRDLAADAQPFISENLGQGNDHSRLAARCICRLISEKALDRSDLRAAAVELAGVKLEEAIKSFRKKKAEAEKFLRPLLETAGQISAHLACALFDWIRGFADYCRAEKKRRSAVDFQDLLFLSARMLRNNKAVRRYFQERFRAFFVDEFQDTDPLQADVIAFLCERPGRNPASTLQEVAIEEGKLFVVGDPKQSIYRFRRADVQVYRQVKALFERLSSDGESVKQVFQNFRSTPQLIAWFNELFERVLGQGLAGDVYQAAHVPLVPQSDAPPSGCAVVALYPPPGVLDEKMNAETARRLEARYLARVLKDVVEGRAPEPVREALGEDGLSYGDVAFLFSALTDIAAYEEALEQSGVPYRVFGGKSFYRREEVGETLSLLRAVDDPLDSVSVVACLRSSYFGLSDEELLRFHERGGAWNYLANKVSEGPAAEALGLLAHWHVLRGRTPPQALLREVLDQTKALEAFNLKPGGRQRVANVQKLLGELRSLWNASHGTFRSIVDYLAGLQEREEAEEESSVVEPGDDFALLLSMHKAKGLQFGCVALPDLARGTQRRAPPLILDRVDRHLALGVGGICSLHYAELRDREEGNVLAERQRLLYVAATRAKRLLILPLHWQKPEKTCMLDFLTESELLTGPDEAPLGEGRDGVFYWDTRPLKDDVRLGREHWPSVSSVAGGASPRKMLAERTRWVQEHDRIALRASTGLRIITPSSLAQVTAGMQATDEGIDEVRGRDFGALFHNVMRRVPLLEAAEGGDLKELCRGLAAMEAARLSLDDGAAEEAARLAVESCRNPEFRALLRGALTVRQEVQFCLPLGKLLSSGERTEGFLEGSINLLIDGKDGTVVLDHKTDATDAPEERACLYWPQLTLYGLAARACMCAVEPVKLVVFFVRHGRVVRRELDEALAGQARQSLALQLGAR